MVSCLRIRGRLPEWRRGRCSAPEAARIAEHLARCPGCRAAARAETELATQLATLTRPAPAVDGWPSVAEHLALPARLQPARPRYRPIARFAVAGAATMALVGGLWLAQLPSEPTRLVSLAPTPTRQGELIALGRVLMPLPASTDDPLRAHANAWLAALQRLAEER
jgi:hypothetical protein